MVADVRYPEPGRPWERDYTGNVTPGLVQEREAAVPLADRQCDPANPPTESAPPQIRPPSRRALSQPEEPSPVGRSTPLRTSAISSQVQAKSRALRQIKDGQRVGEQSAVQKELALPQLCKGVQVQTHSEPAISNPFELPQIVDEHPPPFLMVREPRQGPAPIQRRNSDDRHPTAAVNKEDEALRKEGSMHDPSPGISWEGWGLIRTPDGVYLPETFNPFPHVFEDLTDQR